MKTVVEGHYRALVAQLLQVENLATCDEDGKGRLISKTLFKFMNVTYDIPI